MGAAGSSKGDPASRGAPGTVRGASWPGTWPRAGSAPPRLCSAFEPGAREQLLPLLGGLQAERGEERRGAGREPPSAAGTACAPCSWLLSGPGWCALGAASPSVSSWIFNLEGAGSWGLLLLGFAVVASSHAAGLPALAPNPRAPNHRPKAASCRLCCSEQTRSQTPNPCRFPAPQGPGGQSPTSPGSAQLCASRASSARAPQLPAPPLLPKHKMGESQRFRYATHRDCGRNEPSRAP